MQAYLLSAVTSAPTTGVGQRASELMTHRTYQATVAGTGAVTATVVIQVSNDNTNWIDLGTITLSGTTSATDGMASDTCWPWSRGKVTAISGTGAAVTSIMSAG